MQPFSFAFVELIIVLATLIADGAPHRHCLARKESLLHALLVLITVDRLAVHNSYIRSGFTKIPDLLNNSLQCSTIEHRRLPSDLLNSQVLKMNLIQTAD